MLRQASRNAGKCFTAPTQPAVRSAPVAAASAVVVAGLLLLPLHLTPRCLHAGDDISGLLLDLGRVLAFNEELMDIASAVNEDAPRRQWTPEAVQNIATVGGKLLHFAADKAGSPGPRAYDLCSPQHQALSRPT